MEKRFKASPIAMNNPLSGYSLVFRPRGAHLKLFQPTKQIRYLFKDYYKTNPLAGLVAQNSLGHFKSIKKGPEEYLLHYWGWISQEKHVKLNTIVTCMYLNKQSIKYTSQISRNGNVHNNWWFFKRCINFVDIINTYHM